MRGVSRFDFYIDLWFGGTRGVLSAEAKGIYIDLLCLIYTAGGSLPYVEGEQSERALMGKCTVKRVTTLRRALGELIAGNKIEHRDGSLFNGRATKELVKVARRRGDVAEEPAVKQPQTAREAPAKRPNPTPENKRDQRHAATPTPMLPLKPESVLKPSTLNLSPPDGSGSMKTEGFEKGAGVVDALASLAGRRQSSRKRIDYSNSELGLANRQAFADQELAKKLGRWTEIIAAHDGDAAAFDLCRRTARQIELPSGKRLAWPVPGGPLARGAGMNGHA